MKCSIIIRAYTVCKSQKDHHTKEYIFLLNYNPTPLDLYNGLSQALLYQTRRKNPLVYQGLKSLYYVHAMLTSRVRNPFFIQAFMKVMYAGELVKQYSTEPSMSSFTKRTKFSPAGRINTEKYLSQNTDFVFVLFIYSCTVDVKSMFVFICGKCNWVILLILAMQQYD